MQTDTLKSPCNECPFRKNSAPGWLGEWQPMELLQFINQENDFPCHLTCDDDREDEEGRFENAKYCKGAIQFMANKGQRPRDKCLAQKVEEAKREDLSNILSPPEFIKHHTK